MRCFPRLFPGLLLGGSLAALANAAQPPAGFTALFNGKDLSGWRGGDTHDQRKLPGLPAALIPNAETRNLGISKNNERCFLSPAPAPWR